jgi:hypothetical protein
MDRAAAGLIAGDRRRGHAGPFRQNRRREPTAAGERCSPASMLTGTNREITYSSEVAALAARGGPKRRCLPELKLGPSWTPPPGLGPSTTGPRQPLKRIGDRRLGLTVRRQRRS